MDHCSHERYALFFVILVGSLVYVHVVMSIVGMGVRRADPRHFGT